MIKTTNFVMRNRLEDHGSPSNFLYCWVGLTISLVTASIVHAYPPTGNDVSDDIVETSPDVAATKELETISNVRQLTFEGRRAGEGYFSADGEKMVFQSEREPENPFFQIYMLDFETGDIDRISPGQGKTTCAWIHPNGNKVLYSSTQNDPAAKEKQKQELQLRADGKERRYSWDYDETFELFEFNLKDKSYTKLTDSRGYDAEGSYSPDGKLIAFGSNRAAFTTKLPQPKQEQFNLDPSYMMDLYLMNSDGTHVRQLTDVPGYDGGPFFSPDGKKICWRRFSENGATAEIMTMDIDGSNQQQLTSLGAMSWAPFYHPSGEYLIFTTNRHGFANFELYLVDVNAKSKPVRVTYTKGFDGLPTFTPDGTQISWTSNRTASHQSQIFIANWNHNRALALLSEAMNESKATATESDTETETDTTAVETSSAKAAAGEAARATGVRFLEADIMRHVDYLCRPELKGRLTGTEGEKLATAYVAAYFDQLGLAPSGDADSWYQSFEFTSGVALGEQNRMLLNDKELQLQQEWRPLSFSESGSAERASIVFAGYGIVAPEDKESSDGGEYDSLVHLDVKDQWVMALRFLPESISAERRQHLAGHSSLRYKAMTARDRGARGLIIVSGPNSKVESQLVPLQSDGSLSGTSIPVISITDDVATRLLEASGKSLKELQDQLDSGEPMMGFELKDSKLGGHIEIKKMKRSGRNVIGRLQFGAKPSEQIVIVGAHIDHLGQGASSSSLARDDEREQIHFGADDNASGVAATLEIAEYFSDQKKKERIDPKRDIVFAAWSGEEMGLYGSGHFVQQFGDKVYPAVAACINMDMVGRMDKKLILQGVGSSSIWRSEIERRNVRLGLPITIQEDSYLPTDASSFFMKGVPILSAFTGSHSEYHTPRDTPDLLNGKAAAKIANFMALVTRSLITRDTPPDFIEQTKPQEGQRRARLRAYLGTIPDYADEVKGVKLSGVAKGGPSAEAGMKSGDIIVKVAGKKIENIYDYTYAIEALKIGQTVEIVVKRGEKEIPLDVTPGSRN